MTLVATEQELRPAQLAAVLLGRELAPLRLAAMSALLAGAAGALGYALATRGVLTIAGVLPPGVGAGGAGLEATIVTFGAQLLSVPAAIAACWLVSERICGDHEAAWLPALVAGERDVIRRSYALVVALGATLLALLVHALAVIALVFGARVGGIDVVGRALRGWPGGAALVVSAGAYGAVWAVTLRRRRAALGGALAAVIVPIALLAWYPSAFGAPPSRTLLRLLTLHMPPPIWSSTARALARHAAYIAACAALLAALAPRCIARTR